MSFSKPLHKFIGTKQRDISAHWTARFGLFLLKSNRVTGDLIKLRGLMEEFKIHEAIPSDREDRVIEVLTRPNKEC